MKTFFFFFVLLVCIKAESKDNLLKAVQYSSIDWTAKIITLDRTEEKKIKSKQDDWLFENDKVICRIFKEITHPISDISASTRLITCALLDKNLIISTQAICDPFSATCPGNISISDKENRKIVQILVLGTKKVE